MTYTLPTGDALAFNFSGRTYTPPRDASTLQLLFTAGRDIDYPVPPALTMQAFSSWEHGTDLSCDTDTFFREGQSRDSETQAPYRQATLVPDANHDLGWDSVPIRDAGIGTGWGTPRSEETNAASPWGSTKATDPAPVPAYWDKASLPGERNTKALWGQPPTKDQAYSGPWFRVDTTGPEWRINDHRSPPLWADPPSALAFSFKGSVYVPDKVPDLWFRFDGRVAPHPVQPKDSGPENCVGAVSKGGSTSGPAVGRRTICTLQGQSTAGGLREQG